MTEAALAGWLVVALLGVITPGIDTMLVLRHTVLAGRAGGLTVTAGIVVGCLVWATASLAGLTALLAASQLAYDIVRIVGAAYLIWLGTAAIRKTLPHRQRSAGEGDEESARHSASSWADGLRAGLVTNLRNPKVGVFYISLLPQFLTVGPGATAWGALLVLIHLGVTAAWYPLVILLASRARAVLLRERVRRWLDRVTATVLIGLGVRLAAEAR